MRCASPDKAGGIFRVTHNNPLQPPAGGRCGVAAPDLWDHAGQTEGDRECTANLAVQPFCACSSVFSHHMLRAEPRSPRLRDAPRVQVARVPPHAFEDRTGAKALGSISPIGAVLKSKRAGAKVAEETQLLDPSIRIASALADFLTSEFGMKEVAVVPEPVNSDQAKQLSAISPVLLLETELWGIFCHQDCEHARPFYKVNVKLLAENSGRAAWKAKCNKTIPNEAERVTREQLTENRGALLSDLLGRLAEECGGDLTGELKSYLDRTH